MDDALHALDEYMPQNLGRTFRVSFVTAQTAELQDELEMWQMDLYWGLCALLHQHLVNRNLKVPLSTRMYTVLLASIVHSLPEFERAKFNDDYAVEIEEMKNGIVSPWAGTFPYRLGLASDGMDQERKQQLKNEVTDHLLVYLKKADPTRSMSSTSEYMSQISQKSHWVHWSP